MSTLSDAIAKMEAEQAKAKKKKSTKKRDDNGKFVKADESQISSTTNPSRSWRCSSTKV